MKEKYKYPTDKQKYYSHNQELFIRRNIHQERIPADADRLMLTDIFSEI